MLVIVSTFRQIKEQTSTSVMCFNRWIKNNPTVNLSYFNQLHKKLNPVNNEISLNTTIMQYR